MKKCLGEFLDPIYAAAQKKYEERKNNRDNTGEQEFQKDTRKKLGLKKHKGGGVGPGYQKGAVKFEGISAGIE